MNIYCARLIALIICIVGFTGPALAKCPTRMGSIFIPEKFSVISRRGSVATFPENTLPAFSEALNVDGANSLQADLSLTRDGKVILWSDWDPNSRTAMIRQEKGEPAQKFKPFVPSLKDSRWRKKVSELSLSNFFAHYGYVDKTSLLKSTAEIPTFQNFIEWATRQNKLKLVLFKLKIPAEEKHLASVMLNEIKRVLGNIHPYPHFQFVLLTPHKEILNLIRNQFKEFSFSFDREIFPTGITNYHSFTTVPIAMDFKNSFASIGLPIHVGTPPHPAPPGPDPWLIYKYILTMDFRLRDNFKKSTSNYIKIISWAFNDEKKMRCLINLGVDGIITDRPKILRRIALDMGKTVD
jgi:glycerophosphoryl diester phosphodiesterase